MVSTTQQGAMRYCKWLYDKTGRFFRLPTEAEWEYACRAGTTTKYFFGDDASKLGDYAWYYENSDDKYHKVGTKLPNPWGLYDMLGNVAEWTSDDFRENYHEILATQKENPWMIPAKKHSRTVKGGAYAVSYTHLDVYKRQGLYNGFLAAGLVWSLLIKDKEWHTNVAMFFLVCVLVAGLYGAATASKKILYIQAVPAFIALISLLIWN